MEIPLSPQPGSFSRESFYQLNISCADIPCVLENGVVGGARSTQPVNIDRYVQCGTLHITVNITPPSPNLHNSPPILPPKKLLYQDAFDSLSLNLFYACRITDPSKVDRLLLCRDPFNPPSPNLFYPRRITNPPKLARPCHRVRKR
jgi:hypothetical protein